MRRFGHFLRRLTRACTYGEMVFSTETDFQGDGVFVDSRQALILLWIIPTMPVGDTQSKSIPVHKLFQYSDGSKRVHLTKWVIKSLWFDWSLVVHKIDLQKRTLMEKMPRYVIFNNAYSCSMTVIQSFDINHVLWATTDVFFIGCLKENFWAAVYILDQCKHSPILWCMAGFMGTVKAVIFKSFGTAFLSLCK